MLLGSPLRHTEVPRLVFKSELQLPACATATATWDLSCICELHYSSWQHQILNPLSKARDRTGNLIVPSQICFCCTMMETPDLFFYSFSSTFPWTIKISIYCPSNFLNLSSASSNIVHRPSSKIFDVIVIFIFSISIWFFKR